MNRLGTLWPDFYNLSKFAYKRGASRDFLLLVVLLFLFALPMQGQKGNATSLMRLLAEERYSEAHAHILKQVTALEGNPSEKLWWKGAHAYVLAEESKYEQSDSLLATLRLVPGDSAWGWSQAAQCVSHLRRSNFSVALGFAMRATTHFAQQGRHERTAYFFRLQSICFHYQLHFGASEQALDSARFYYSKANWRLGLLVTERLQGQFIQRWMPERSQRAEAILQSAVQGCKTLDAPRQLALTYFVLLETALLQKDEQKAGAYYDSAGYVLRRVPDSLLVLLAEHSEAGLALLRGDFARCLSVCGRVQQHKQAVLGVQQRNRLVQAKALVGLQRAQEALAVAQLLAQEAASAGDLLQERDVLDFLVQEPRLNASFELRNNYFLRLMHVKDRLYSNDNMRQTKLPLVDSLSTVVRQSAVPPSAPWATRWVLAMLAMGLLLCGASVYYVWLLRVRLRHVQQEQETLHGEYKMRESATELELYNLKASLVAEEKSRFKHILQARKEERSSISHYLHDETAVRLHQLRQLVFALMGTQSDVGQKSEQLSELELKLRLLQMDVSHISHELSPEKFNEYSLTEHFERLLQQRCGPNNISYTLFVDDRAENILFAHPFLKMVLHEAVLTAVNNVVRHANASELSVNLFYFDELIVTVDDNGLGFADCIPGLGFRILQSTAEFFSGRFQYDSRPGHGTTITLVIPELALGWVF